jgi:nucleotide-binding universal stress UspA family protein
MGTQGESRFEEILFGSTTVDVMKQAKCPVLAIPPEATFRGIERIVYATDLEEKDLEVIKHLCDLASIFGAEVVIFHAFGEDNMMLQEEANEFNDLLQKQIHYPKLKKESITYGNSHDAILDVIKKDLADMIVMREKKRGIFSRLFHPDMVKRVNYHTTIPLLTYNDDSL